MVTWVFYQIFIVNGRSYCCNENITDKLLCRLSVPRLFYVKFSFISIDYYKSYAENERWCFFWNTVPLRTSCVALFPFISFKHKTSHQQKNIIIFYDSFLPWQCLCCTSNLVPSCRDLSWGSRVLCIHHVLGCTILLLVCFINQWMSGSSRRQSGSEFQINVLELVKLHNTYGANRQFVLWEVSRKKSYFGISAAVIDFDLRPLSELGL